MRRLAFLAAFAVLRVLWWAVKIVFRELFWPPGDLEGPEHPW